MENEASVVLLTQWRLPFPTKRQKVHRFRCPDDPNHNQQTSQITITDNENFDKMFFLKKYREVYLKNNNCAFLFYLYTEIGHFFRHRFCTLYF